MDQKVTAMGVAMLLTLLVAGALGLAGCVASTRPEPVPAQYSKTAAAHPYKTVTLRVIGVGRVDAWLPPSMRSMPEHMRMGGVRITKQGWEFAVVSLEVTPGPDYKEQLVGKCSEVIDVKGNSYKSAVVDEMSMSVKFPYECPFAVPERTQLKTFRMESLVFDLEGTRK